MEIGIEFLLVDLDSCVEVAFYFLGVEALLQQYGPGCASIGAVRNRAMIVLFTVSIIILL